ncbi:MAG: undecaprenyldiphospho-muramoylpentapeptide beta-N-acetylglucosaminyltransferase [Rhodothalassiaceae bacterium]
MTIGSASLHLALVAGGTGGHMAPAFALASEMKRRGHRLSVISDRRGMSVPGLFSAEECHVLETGHMSGSLTARIGTGARVLGNIGKSRAILKAERPDIVVGFGGYPALAALVAARSLGIPICLHEQNAVLGRVNRLLAPFAALTALSFAGTARLPRRARHRAVLTGTPVRREIAELAKHPYPKLDEEHMLRLLVVGGSLGAHVLSEVVPDALSLLPEHLKRRLQVTQQCRPEDLERAASRYRESGIAAELMPYINDMPERLFWCHLAICRAGASTLAELAAAGRPGIFVPLPGAADDHQTANARHFSDNGAGWTLPQADFNPKTLARSLQSLARDPDRLARAAAAARALGMPDAAAHLADAIEGLARRKAPTQSGSAMVLT